MWPCEHQERQQVEQRPAQRQRLALQPPGRWRARQAQRRSAIDQRHRPGHIAGVAPENRRNRGWPAGPTLRAGAQRCRRISTKPLTIGDQQPEVETQHQHRQQHHARHKQPGARALDPLGQREPVGLDRQLVRRRQAAAQRGAGRTSSTSRFTAITRPVSRARLGASAGRSRTRQRARQCQQLAHKGQRDVAQARAARHRGVDRHQSATSRAANDPALPPASRRTTSQPQAGCSAG